MTLAPREVAVDETDMRLDRWFRKNFPTVHHILLQRLLRTGQVRVDGRRAKANQRLTAGQSVRVPPEAAFAPPATTVRAKVPAAEAARLRDWVLHRDERVIVIDKPAGLAVQGGSNQTRHLDAMLDALRFGSAERPRLVHRLDQDTSGVLVLARTGAVARDLSAQFRGREVHKLYLAVVVGRPRQDQGRIDQPLAKRSGPHGERVAVDEEEGKRAVTRYRILDAAGDRFALVALEPLTGRTHQLRVHCATLGTPILGDAKYGGKAAAPAMKGIAKRLHLHAASITLPDGVTVAAPLPPHIRETLKALGLGADPEDVSLGPARRGRAASRDSRR
ncbi:MAG: RluA family pseudouridine synthase [Alphaproteobacteria bacterium]|nr:RluA family pseudouridine synthase [Alphaproteobacteria bacterium]